MKHYVVSDLHLGMGRDENGALHPLEDFDSDREFEQLLEMALRDGGSLIINGDWLDFLQVEPFVPIGDYRSAEGIPLAYPARIAMEKLDTLLRQQARHFQALGSFLKRGGRVAIVQGNHDADWFFPDANGGVPPLQARIRAVLGNPDAERLRFLDRSLQIGSVYIEHGHQRCEHVNEFQQHPNIFHPDRKSALLGELRIELLWGSRLVMEFFNDLEREYPFADNLKPMTRAMWLGIRNRWVNGRTAASFLRFMVGAGLPLRDFPEVLDAPGDEPVALIQRLEDDSLKAMLLERVQQDPEFYQELESELAQAPAEEKAQWHASQRSAIGPEEVAPLGEQQVAGLVRDSREFREAGALLETPGIQAVLFGHTHFAIDGNDPNAKKKGYFNTGTWIPALDLADPQIQRRLRTEDFPLELLRDRSLFKRRLTYAEITEADDGGRVELLEMPT